MLEPYHSYSTLPSLYWLLVRSHSLCRNVCMVSLLPASRWKMSRGRYHLWPEKIIRRAKFHILQPIHSVKVSAMCSVWYQPLTEQVNRSLKTYLSGKWRTPSGTTVAILLQLTNVNLLTGSVQEYSTLRSAAIFPRVTVGKNYPIFSPPTPFTHTFLLPSPIFYLHRIMAPLFSDSYGSQTPPRKVPSFIAPG